MMTRDSKIWVVLKVISSILLPLTTFGDPEALGLTGIQMNWIQLVNAIVLGLSAGLGNSMLPGKDEKDRG